MSTTSIGTGEAPATWSASLPIHHADDAADHPRSAFLKGLRAAHASGLDLAEAAEAWTQAVESEELAEAFATIQHDAEEMVHRVEYIMAGLRRSPRGGTSWIARADGAMPGDADCAAAASRALQRLAQATIEVERLAHDLAEHQAARLLRMSADEHAASARRLAAAPAQPIEEQAP